MVLDPHQPVHGHPPFVGVGHRVIGDFLFQVAIFGDAQGANWHVVMHGRAVALALFEACFGASASRLPAF